LDLEQERKLKPWMLNLALIFIGIIFAGLMALIFLTIFPQYRPGMVVYRVKLGDIFFNHPEWMAIPDNYEEILSVHYVGYDQEGFRLPERQADKYQILGIGDSYTEAANVARPWTDVLAQKSGMTVRNLGYRALGPVEEATIIDISLSAFLKVMIWQMPNPHRPNPCPCPVKSVKQTVPCVKSILAKSPNAMNATRCK
jgi:hypothetical protein